MPIPDRNRIYDGWLSLEGGVDAGRNPATLAPNQCQSGENLTFRGGDAGVRPGFRKLVETYSNGNHRYLPNGVDAYAQQTGEKASDVYKTGVFQCAHGFTPHGGEDCLMVMIGGRLFRVVPGLASCVVTEITPIEDTSSPYSDPFIQEGEREHQAYRNKRNLPIAYMTQADKYLVVQDGLAKPIIYDGQKARRSVLETDIDHTEVPVGTIMTYGMGRLVVIVNKRDVAFGDLYGSHPDFDDPADSLVLFTERNFLAEGFDAAIPFNQGVATGAIFFPQLDTSTGNGELMVFAERGAAAFFLSLPRDLWKSSRFQILALLTTGMRGHRSVAVVNEDLWFRSADGMRTYRQARSEPSGSVGGWAHIPLSTNIRQYLDHDAQWLLKYCSSIYFNNRILTTTTPYWNQGRPYFNGIAVVDFDILSSFGRTERPAWDGHWSKMAITQLVTGEFDGVTRAFAFGIDENGYNQLYELSLSDNNDWDGQIPWELVSRSFNFKSAGSSQFNENEIYDADIWIKDIR